MDVVSKWATDYIEWATEHRQLLEDTYQWFLREGTWPKLDELQRDIWARYHKRIDLNAILESRPIPPGRPRRPSVETFSLTVRDFALIEAARPLADLVAKATEVAVEVYGEQSQELVVKREYMQPERMSSAKRALLDRLPELIFSENPSPFAGSSSGPDWSLVINSTSVLRFEGVNNLSSYLEAQEQYFRELDEQAHGRKRPEVGLPLTTFVVMPFGEAWSDQVFDAIERSVAAVDPTIVVVRADRIRVPGKITEQIVDSIVSSNFIVADVTASNPNVFWELGYAHAVGRPTVLLTQDVSGAPFDLKDHRMVTYEYPLTSEVEQFIAEHIASAVNLVRQGAS